MNKFTKLIILLILLLGVKWAGGQTDCLMWYSYEGTIVSDSLDAISIELPTARNLLDLSKKDGSNFPMYQTTAINGGVFYRKLLSSGCYYCGESDELTHRIFKRDEGPFKKEGPMVYSVIIHLQGSNKTITKTIPVELINFGIDDSSGSKVILIDLGKITI